MIRYHGESYVGSDDWMNDQMAQSRKENLNKQPAPEKTDDIDETIDSIIAIVRLNSDDAACKRQIRKLLQK